MKIKIEDLSSCRENLRLFVYFCAGRVRDREGVEGRKRVRW